MISYNADNRATPFEKMGLQLATLHRRPPLVKPVITDCDIENPIAAMTEIGTEQSIMNHRQFDKDITYIGS